MIALPGTLQEERTTTDLGVKIMSDALPVRDDVGSSGTWTITNRHGESVVVKGMFLGLGSSHRPYHNHNPIKPAPPRTHCSTCRWTEIRIFSLKEGGYLVVNRGASDVPGERDLVEFEPLLTAHEVMEKLTTRREGDAFLTTPASRAASQAAEFDGRMRDAYINRAVT